LLRCQDGRCCAAKTAATSPFVVAALSWGQQSIMGATTTIGLVI
jgi:hypothetical protein